MTEQEFYGLIHNPDSSKTEASLKMLSEIISEDEMNTWIQDSLGETEAAFLRDSSVEEYAAQVNLYKKYEEIKKAE